MTSPTHSSTSPTHSSIRIDILLFEGVEELDAVGPWEIFAAWCEQHPEDGGTVRMISREGGLVQCAKGLTLQAHAPLDNLEGCDVLVHPGGIGTRALVRDESHLRWLREARDRVGLLTSVCTGSLVYAAAGLLQNTRATTHWAALDELAALDSTITVEADTRYVDEGNIITSAGVSAGIDMSLHVLERLVSTERAEHVRRYVDYAPGWTAGAQ